MSWRVHLRLGRVSNLPTVWTNVLAGAVLAGGPLAPGPLVAVALALSLLYVGGMYLNDAFDREIDARERPERPIPAGAISARAVFATGYGLFTVAVAILAVVFGPRGNWSPALAGVGLAGVITYYDAHHKANPLSPVVMGLCRVLVYVIAALAVAGRVAGPVLGGATILLLYLVGVTYVAKQETLAEYRNLWPLAFLFAPFVYGLPTLAASAAGAAVYLGFLGWVLYGISRLVRRGRVSIPRAVVALLAGISLLDALLIAGAGRPGLAAAAVLGFGVMLAGQRWVKGT